MQHNEASNKKSELSQHMQSEIELEGKRPVAKMFVKSKDPLNKRQMDERLKMVTHVHLERMGIQIIDNLQLCPKLSHIFLQEN